MTASYEMLHATSVAISGMAVVILGPSGSGKSSLALRLIALGGTLVSDDRTIVQRDGAHLKAAAPAAISGLIEARGVGLIRVPIAPPTRVGLFIDLSRFETERLPERHTHSALGVTLPCLHNADSSYFPSAIFLYMKGNIEGPL